MIENIVLLTAFHRFDFKQIEISRLDTEVTLINVPHIHAHKLCSSFYDF